MTASLIATVQTMAASIALRANPHDLELSERYRVCLAESQRLGLNAAAETLRLRLELSDSEFATLWLLVGLALSSELRAVAESLTGLGRGDATQGQVQTLLFNAAPMISVAVLSGESRLRRYQLIERVDSGEVHESRRSWAVAPRVLRWFDGSLGLDSRLEGIAEVERTLDAKLTGAYREAFCAAQGSHALVVVAGAAGTGRRSMLRASALEACGAVLEVDCTKLSRATQDLRAQAQTVLRECRLLEAVPLFRNLDALEAEMATMLVSAFDELRSPMLATCRQRLSPRGGRPIITLDAVKPTAAARATMWLHALGQGTSEDAEYLATQYPIAPALIHHAAKAAKARANGRKMEPEDIYAGVRAVLDDKLGDYARRVEVTQTWDDLVLPEDQMEQVQYLIARIRQRRTVYEQWGFAAKVGKGLGTSALFSGPPGTGKTMVAALIAKELGLELYQVDMAKITSKYIGETERNLAALFDAAEAGHAILLFDEADSLFGKRTEVKSSNDRYANLETNYLLQRLESFTGICLLTSNHESNIDPAFQRRLSLHVRFELPEAEERAALWQATLPAAAPVAEGVDFMKLATKYAMSGGYIRNAALRAAFLAADEGSEITAAHLERAAKLEYEGMGKIAA